MQTQQQDPADRPRLLHGKFKADAETLAAIGANLLPVYGVWFVGWSAVEVFIVYAMETIIVGVFTIVKMLLAGLFGPGDRTTGNSGTTGQGSLFLIPFFCIHYGMFVAIQTTIFSQVANIVPAQSGMFHFFFHPFSYINKDIALMLGAFSISYAWKLLPFIFNGEYRKTPVAVLMFQPYGRIFIQQFTVIFGSMFLIFGLGKVFILIFALARICFEIYFNFDALLSSKLATIVKKKALQE